MRRKKLNISVYYQRKNPVGFFFNNTNASNNGMKTPQRIGRTYQGAWVFLMTGNQTGIELLKNLLPERIIK